MERKGVGLLVLDFHRGQKRHVPPKVTAACQRPAMPCRLYPSSLLACALVKLPKRFVVRRGIIAKESPPPFLSELDGPRLSTNVLVLR